MEDVSQHCCFWLRKSSRELVWGVGHIIAAIAIVASDLGARTTVASMANLLVGLEKLSAPLFQARPLDDPAKNLDLDLTENLSTNRRSAMALEALSHHMAWVQINPPDVDWGSQCSISQ